ncbi:hypothetical protein [Cellulomonas hominis]
MRRALHAVAVCALGLGAAALAAPASAADVDPGSSSDSIEVQVTVPDLGQGTVAVDDARLRWGLSTEAGAGAFFGGCNFLSAGAVGDTGGGRVWTEADGFYRSTAGDVSIRRTTTAGADEAVTFGSRCLDPAGRPVSTADLRGTGAEVVIDGGSGEVDRSTGTATIRWSGAFTVVFYGGLTYWSASDPVLTVGPDGTGPLTATASGYGTSMADQTIWEALPPAQVVLADLRGVSLDDPTGFTVVPQYLGVAVRGPGIDQAPRSAGDESFWGSFPQSFVDFQVRTGQGAYWYTSGGQRDRAKLPLPLAISYDASAPVAGGGPGSSGGGGSGGGGGTATVSNPVVLRPSASATPPRSLSAVAAGTAGVAGEVPAQALFPVVAAQTVLPESSLIPTTVARAFDEPREQVLWATGGLLALGSVAALGFVKGWLVLPWLVR